MEIEQLEINKFVPYEFNSRKHSDEQIDRLANSIKMFGFNQPIVIDESNIILCGHGRFEAAKKINLKILPCVRLVGLNENQKKAYRIIDNKLALDSDWDFEHLELELQTLSDDSFDLKEFGIDDLLREDDKNLIDGAEASKELLVVIECASEQQQQQIFDACKSNNWSCKIIA